MSTKTINNWYNIITNNELHSCNKVSTRDIAMCVNFIQLPDTSTLALTVSIMKNKVKKNSLNPMSFAKVMSCIENSLDSSMLEYESDTSNNIEEEHFANLKSQLDSKWYIQLCCHRVFFIPSDSLWIVIKNLFRQENIRIMKQNELSEITVFTNTDLYDFNARFY